MHIHKEQKVASHIFDGAGVSAATRSPLRFGLAIADIRVWSANHWTTLLPKKTQLQLHHLPCTWQSDSLSSVMFSFTVLFCKGGAAHTTGAEDPPVLRNLHTIISVSACGSCKKHELILTLTQAAGEKLYAHTTTTEQKLWFWCRHYKTTTKQKLCDCGVDTLSAWCLVICRNSTFVFSAAAGDSEHRFSEYNFSTLQRCHLCDKLLYGLVHQGLQCRGESLSHTVLGVSGQT